MITCYLDSQDYSVLTDPRTVTAEQEQLRKNLLELADSGEVRFCFSAAAVSEAAPLSADSAHLATLKADLLSDLCKSNALFSFDRLIRVELEALTNKCHSQCDMHDAEGNWFPEIQFEEDAFNPWATLKQATQEEFLAQGLNRQQRRAATRKIVKNDQPKAAFRDHLAKQDARAIAAELMEIYPMRPDFAERIVSCALGRASENDFNDALMASLRDPRWMMKWFTTRPALANPVAEMIRKPGREMGEIMRHLASVTKRMGALLCEADPHSKPTGRDGEISNRWTESQERQLINLAQRLSVSMCGAELPATIAGEVDNFCPGLATAVRSLYSSVWDNIGGSRKELPSNSQPVDALHAMYAPYVDVFRADRFMAPHIQKFVKHRNTTVVPKLSMLCDVLHHKISEAASIPNTH